MRINEVNDRTPLSMKQLLAVWEDSVKHTHLFLTDDEIAGIKQYVMPALTQVAHLIIVEDDNNNPIAFMGLEAQNLEIYLFHQRCEARESGASCYSTR